jgi:hypothetical protein
LANTAGLVDEVIRVHEGMDPASAGAVPVRVVITNVAQRAISYIWNLRNWTFRQGEGTVSCTTGVGNLPSDFLRFGPHGGVFKTAAQWVLDWIPLSEMESMRLAQAQSGTAELYSVGGTRGLSESNYGSRVLYVYPFETATFQITYERMVPTLVDGGHSFVPPALPTDGLLILPSAFYSALYERTVYLRMMDKGNMAQVSEQRTIYSEALADLIKVEQQGIEASHSMAPYPLRNL